MLSEKEDPVQLRGGSLAWYFPLFFIVHALMPLGASIAIAGASGEVLVFVIAVPLGALVSGVALFFMLRWAFRAKARLAHFEAARNGRRAAAQVLWTETLGRGRTVRRLGKRTDYYKARVAVRATLEDRVPFELVCEACYTETELGLLTPGASVSIGLHPSGASPFMIHPESIQPNRRW